MKQTKTLTREERLDYFKNSTLLLLILINCFFLTLLPAEYFTNAYRIAFTLIIITTYFTLEDAYRRYSILSIVIALILYWTSYYVDSKILDAISSIFITIVFFSTVISLLKQVSGIEKASIMTIIQALSGYLLMGMVFSLAFAVLGRFEPDSFNFTLGVEHGSIIGFNNYLYFTFISMGTVGFGDLLPLTPFARSLTSFAGIAGQIYIAIVIAMLIGKFNSK